MDEEIATINSNTRNEKIRNLIINNKSKIIFFLISIVIILITFFSFSEYKKRVKEDISDNFNLATINYNIDNKEEILFELIKVIKSKDSTYSPLALYFIIDNELTKDNEKINSFFDLIIQETSLDDEIKNLIIYKKALFNADNIEELELLNILRPINNSNSVWKSHSLFLLGEYYLLRGEKQKAKEFFLQIETLINGNSNIKIKTKKRLSRDLSD